MLGTHRRGCAARALVIEDTTRNHGRQDSHHRCTPEADTARAEAGAPSLIWPSLVVGATSRAALFVLVYFSSSLLAHRNVGGKLLTPDARDFTGLVGRLFNPWANWDGVWYIRIAGHGYAAYPDSQAFFPLYPLLVHYLGRALGSEFELAGIVLSLACFLALCVMLYKLAAREFSPRVGLLDGRLPVRLPDEPLLPGRLHGVAVRAARRDLLLLLTARHVAAGRPRRPAGDGDARQRHRPRPAHGAALPARAWLGPAQDQVERGRAVACAGRPPALDGLPEEDLRRRPALPPGGSPLGRTFAWPWQTVARGVSDAYYGLKGIPYQPLVAGRPQRRLDQVAKYYVDNPDSTMRSSSATSPRSSPSPWLGS